MNPAGNSRNRRRIPDLAREFEKGRRHSGSGAALFGGGNGSANVPAAGAGEVLVPIKQIDAPQNPRKKFNDATIKELAASIESTGLLQPITVRRRGDRYELIYGERRLRAYRLLKRSEIPAIVRSVHDLEPEAYRKARLIENIQREDLSKKDLALAVQELVAGLGSQAAAARELGKHKTYVSRKVAHAQLIEAVPAAADLDSTAAASIAARPPAEWPALVREALASGSNAREQARALTGERQSAGKPESTRLAYFAKQMNGMRKRFESLPAQDRKVIVKQLSDLLKELKKESSPRKQRSTPAKSKT